MASTSAISGLVSGLDTKTIISQLMSIAKAPQDDLKTSLAKTNTQITAAQSINSKAASMTSLAKELATAKTYTTASASSTDASVSATASATASSGSITFTVKQLATAHVVLSDAIPSASGDPAPAIRIGATDYAADTIAALAEKINKAADATVTATVVNGDSSQRLQLTAKDTGSAKAFTVTGTGFTDSDNDTVSTVVKQGQNAQIAIGDTTGSGAVTLSSPSNTFKDLMTGVDVTVSAKDKTATVSTSVNSSAITSKVSGLVAAMNSVLSDVAFHTKALTTGTTASAINGGLLRGNSTMRDLASQVVNAVNVGTPGGDNATLVGLTVTRQGEVAFDAATFGRLYKDDPSAAAAVLQSFSAAVQAVGSQASDPVDGAVTGFINGSQNSIRSITDSIASWDARLSLKQKRLEMQYGALEVALGKLSSQSDGLAAALKQLNGNN